MPRWIISLALLVAFALPAIAAEIRVFAAASLTDALKQIAADYKNKSGDEIVFNLGASNFLARQIAAGAPADIYFSADENWMDDMARKGFVVTGSRRNRLSNSLVIVVPADAKIKIESPSDLRNSNVKRLALADPAGVPAGVYAKKFLEHAGLWNSLTSKIVPTDNVRAALAAVEAGNADAAIVYKTDARIAKKTRVAFELPAVDTIQIRYPVALLKDAPNAAGARKFVDYLFSPEATAVFREYGFGAP